MNATTIYILRLQGGRYYIGKSDDVPRRYQEHHEGTGSAWTKLYPPIALERTISSASPFDEDKITKEYMARYGIAKVRGGAYVSVDLNENQHVLLQKEIWAAQDCCTRCGHKGHYVSSCHACTDSFGNVFEDDVDSDDYEEYWVCELCDAEFDSEIACIRHERTCKSSRNACFRCGRKGHYANDCFATSHVRGYRLF